MQVANAVRRARPPDRIIQQAPPPAPPRPVPRPGCRRQDARRHGTASRARAAVAPSRTAAGRRHWNSCRTGSARTPRPAPGWRSRRLAAPFVAGEVGVDLALAQARKPDHTLHQPLAAGRRGRSSTTAVITLWRRPDSSQAAPRVRFDLCLGQDAATGGDHGVGGRRGTARTRQPRLPSRAPGAERAGGAVRSRSGNSSMSVESHAVRHDADLRQKRETPRAGGRQNQRGGGHLKRGVIRPLLRS